MRNGFLSALTDMARNDENVVLITGDLGFGSFEAFEREFPRQYFNAGIAEQSMVGIASGLAIAGKIVFVYSIGNFSTLRCLEQIRNDACYHDLNVNFVSLGGGFSYGQLGVSHHATEDVSIMRSLPNMRICCPSSDSDAYNATQQLASLSGPSYLRLEKLGVDNCHSEEFNIGSARLLKSNQSEVLLVSLGSLISEVLEASEQVSVDVLELHTPKPINKLCLGEILKKYRTIITVEEHQVIGGIGSVIAEFISDINLNVKLIRLGIDDMLISEVGDQEYLRKVIGIDSSSIIQVVNRECYDRKI